VVRQGSDRDGGWSKGSWIGVAVAVLLPLNLFIWVLPGRRRHGPASTLGWTVVIVVLEAVWLAVLWRLFRRQR
jgi:hypothetical protein